jgi:protein-S-isoprenylcysteine O-methyltransferase Ste14
VKHALFLIYGLAAYLIFLATFLYAIAFIGGFLVPTQLDGPLQGSLAPAIAIDLGLLLVFALQHSVMARRGFKEHWTRIVPRPIERSTYVLASSLALSLLFWQWRPLGVVIWDVASPAGIAAIRMLFGLGFATALATTLCIDHFDLFGLRQVWLTLKAKPYAPVSLRTPLLYRIVRHPLYLGFLVAFWAAPRMTLAHLLFALGITVYVLIAIQLEERDLVAEHGAAYERYRSEVPMLLPAGRRLRGAPASWRQV